MQTRDFPAMKIFPRLGLPILIFCLSAQAGELSVPVTPPQAVNRISLIDPALLGFGTPGFSLAVTASQRMDYDDAERGLDYLDARLRLPLYGKDLGNGSVAGVSLGYGFASLDPADAQGLDRQILHSIALQFTAAHFPTTATGWMGILVVSPGISSDLGRFRHDDFDFNAIAVAGWQFSERFTLAAAGFYSHSIGEDVALPGAGVIWRPTDTLIVQITPPIGAIGWTPVPDWTFSLAAYPGGGSWAIDRQGRDKNVEALQLEVWRAGLGVERRLGSHWRISALAGVNFGGSLEIRTDRQVVIEQHDLNSSAFGLLGVAWSF